MDNTKEQCACIKFCLKTRKIPTETFELIILAFNWFKCFKENRISIENDHGCGCPLLLKINNTFAPVRKKL